MERRLKGTQEGGPSRYRHLLYNDHITREETENTRERLVNVGDSHTHAESTSWLARLVGPLPQLAAVYLALRSLLTTLETARSTTVGRGSGIRLGVSSVPLPVLQASAPTPAQPTTRVLTSAIPLPQAHQYYQFYYHQRTAPTPISTSV